MFIGGREHYIREKSRGSMGGAEVRALAFNQCGLGSNPSVKAICGLSLLLVLSLALLFSHDTKFKPVPCF